MNRELFKGNDDAYMRATAPEAGFGRVSEYVLGELPADLLSVRDETIGYSDLAGKQAGIVDNLEHAILTNTSPELARLLQLDLLFMLGGYLPAGADAYRNTPPSVLAMLEYQAERFGLPRRMDFDLIIDANSEEFFNSGAIRTYLDGESAVHERDFYTGHYLAEPTVKAASYALKTVVETPAHVNANNHFEYTAKRMTEFKNYMNAYARLPKTVFDTLRPYLREYPDGVRYASGAFLPSVQLMELLLVNPGVDSQYEALILNSLPYYPDWARPIIENQLKISAQGRNLEDVIKNGEIDLDTTSRVSLLATIDQFIHFRKAHLRITNTKIPEAFEGKALPKNTEDFKEFGEKPILEPGSVEETGSAGFDILNILGNSVARLERLKERVEEAA